MAGLTKAKSWMLVQEGPLCTGGAWYDLTVELQERSGRFVGWLEYDRDVFEPGTIARLAGHFRTLAAAAAADPDLRVADLPMLTEAERACVAETWNATGVDYPLEICLHGRVIEAQRRADARRRFPRAGLPNGKCCCRTAS